MTNNALRLCAARGESGEHLIRLRRSQPAWMCTTHWQILLELRKGRIRSAIDTTGWRLRGRGQR